MKTLLVSIFLLDGTKERKRVSAPAGKRWTDNGIDQILKNFATYCDRAFPGREFRLVPLRDGNFNFVEFEPEQCEASA